MHRMFKCDDVYDLIKPNLSSAVDSTSHSTERFLFQLMHSSVLSLTYAQAESLQLNNKHNVCTCL